MKTADVRMLTRHSTREPQGRIATTRTTQATRLKGHPLRILSPATARKGYQDPEHSDRANEYPKAEYNRRIRSNCAQRSFDSRPKFRVVIRDIRQQASHYRRAPPMYVWIMHQADCQLGRYRASSLPQPPNTGIKDRLQVCFPKNASQRSNGIANLHHAPRI